MYDSTKLAPTGDNQIVVQYLTANRYVQSTLGIQDSVQAAGIQCMRNGIYNRGTPLVAPGRAIKYAAGTPVTDLMQRPRPDGIRNLTVLAQPNPFRSRVRLAVESGSDGPIRAAIYDAAGRLVRSLSALPTTHLTITWDAHDEGGFAVEPGVYFYRVVQAGGTASGKLILTR